MNNLEQQIEEAALKQFRILLVNPDVDDKNREKYDDNKKIRQAYIDGAKSPEAKAYWQQEMFTKEEVLDSVNKATNNVLKEHKLYSEEELQEYFNLFFIIHFDKLSPIGFTSQKIREWVNTYKK